MFKRTAVHGSLPGWSHFCVGSAFWCWRVASLQVRDMFVFVARALSSCARLSFRQDTCFFNYYVVYLSFWETFFLSFQQVTLSPRWLAVGASYMWLSMVSDPAAGTTPAYEDSTDGVPEFRFRVDYKPLLPPASPNGTALVNLSHPIRSILVFDVKGSTAHSELAS